MMKRVILIAGGALLAAGCYAGPPRARVIVEPPRTRVIAPPPPSVTGTVVVRGTATPSSQPVVVAENDLPPQGYDVPPQQGYESVPPQYDDYNDTNIQLETAPSVQIALDEPPPVTVQYAPPDFVYSDPYLVCQPPEITVKGHWTWGRHWFWMPARCVLPPRGWNFATSFYIPPRYENGIYYGPRWSRQPVYVPAAVPRRVLELPRVYRPGQVIYAPPVRRIPGGPVLVPPTRPSGPVYVPPPGPRPGPVVVPPPVVVGPPRPPVVTQPPPVVVGPPRPPVVVGPPRPPVVVQPPPVVVGPPRPPVVVGPPRPPVVQPPPVVVGPPRPPVVVGPPRPPVVVQPPPVVVHPPQPIPAPRPAPGYQPPPPSRGPQGGAPPVRVAPPAGSVRVAPPARTLER